MYTKFCPNIFTEEKRHLSWVEEYRQERLTLDELNQSIRRHIDAINADWTEDDILGFSDIITRRDRLASFDRRQETLQKNQDRLDDQIGILKARRLPINMQNVFIVIGSALVIGASTLVVFRNYLWGSVLMIIGIILTAVGLGRMLGEYSPVILERAFFVVAAIAFILGLLGLIRLEPRLSRPEADGVAEERVSFWHQLRFMLNRQVVLFFVYLVLMLTAILGQDILLEPFAAEAFDMSVQDTTRITAIWGVCFLLSLITTGLIESRLSKRTGAIIGAWVAILAFLLIASGGLAINRAVFYTGVVLLGSRAII